MPITRRLRAIFSRSPGFTLIELLVAMLLLSLIFVLLTSGLQFGTNAWSGRGGQSDGGSSEVLSAQGFLRSVFSTIRPVMVEADPTHARHVYFVGLDHSIRFIASLPERVGIGGFYEVGISLADGDSGRVEMSWRLFRSGDNSIPERQVELISKANSIEFTYFGSRAPNDPPRWYSDWQSVDHLPDLIRMRVAFNDANRFWPDLVVAPMIRSLDLIIDPEHIAE